LAGFSLPIVLYLYSHQPLFSYPSFFMDRLFPFHHLLLLGSLVVPHRTFLRSRSSSGPSLRAALFRASHSHSHSDSFQPWRWRRYIPSKLW
jgi:hypothetical protein